MDKRLMVILFDLLPAQGHFNASLKLATLLKNSGHDVNYCSAPDFSSFVTKNGFSFYGMFDGLTVAAPTDDKTTAMIREYDLLISRLQPDIVILDQQQMHKYLIYNRRNIPVCAIQTKPATNKERNIPPFTSFFIPRRSMFSILYTELIWGKYFLRESLSRLLDRIKNKPSELQKIASAIGVSLAGVDRKRCFCIHFKGAPEMILSPAAFDFPRKPAQRRHFVGPLNDLRADEAVVNDRYIAVRDMIVRQRTKDAAVKLIYCSMGTVTESFFGKCDRFFKQVKKVCRKNAKYKIIMSVGAYYQIERLMPLPENLFIFASLPQTDVLKHADLMITHGGMNSITECIYNEVPMLVYPLSPRWDQPGNSARVVYHGLGLRGRIGRDTANSTSHKIRQIFDSYPFIKENLRNMKHTLEKNNQSLQAVTIIENYAKNNSE